jgi:homoserine kinase
VLTWTAEPVTVTVPATSANLGPGFDSLGLALSLHDAVQARVQDAGVDVEVTGFGTGEVGTGEQHLVIRAMRAAFAALGAQPPGISIRCRNAVPQGFGLGSSAAAITAGLLAARALAAASPAASMHAAEAHAGLPDDDLLRLASDLEGHPDNVAACLRGGLTIAWTAVGGVRAARLSPLPGLAPVLCVPAVPLLTEMARKALPARIPHADAAANSARTALLIAALTSRPDLLLAGTEDFLHQQYRAESMPASADLIARLRRAGIAAVVSGAGPAVLALTVAGVTAGPDDVARIVLDSGTAWKVRSLRVDDAGARVSPSDPRTPSVAGDL